MFDLGHDYITRISGNKFKKYWKKHYLKAKIKLSDLS